MTAIFISHSSADRIAAKDMKRWLEAQGHTSLFLDFDVESGIKAGSDWEQTLYQKLRQCQAVIALLTPDWIASKWCFAELVQARERGKAIFLVKVQPCETREIFADIQHIDLTAQPEEGYRRLKAGLLECGLDPLDVFDWDPKRPPYPGFMAFQEADAAIFFGRGLDIDKTRDTLEALRRQGREAPPLVLLLGASGSGKSSLARAGVIPRLRKQPAQWLPVPPFRPQLEPLDELAMSLALAFKGQKQPRDWRSIRAELEQATQQPVDGRVLVHLARDLALAAGQPEVTVLLTIDQAEELFGGTAPEPATRFLRLLRAGLEAADRRLMAIATLRSDFMGDFQNHPTLQDGEYPHHFRYRVVPVDPMLLGSFAEIIRGPAQLAGLQLADGLVETMVADTGTRDALPLLAFTLRRLYDRFGGDGRLTVAEYEELGRLDGAVREEAQRIIGEANPTTEQREALHAAFVPALVRINAEGGYARRRALLNNLPQAAVPLLRRFVDARLLVTDRDADGRETIEVAHEALLRTWPPLKDQIDAQATALRARRVVENAAKDWDAGGRDRDALLHGPPLTQAKKALEAEMKWISKVDPNQSDSLTERLQSSSWWPGRRLVTRVDLDDTERKFLEASMRSARWQWREWSPTTLMWLVLFGLLLFSLVVPWLGFRIPPPFSYLLKERPPTERPWTKWVYDADEAFNGFYHLVRSVNGQFWSIWHVPSTNCSSADSCVAGVITVPLVPGSTGYGNAQSSNGQWAMTIDDADGRMCRDETRAPSHNEYSWSASTLSGTVVKSWGAVCGDAPGSSTYTFTMKRLM